MVNAPAAAGSELGDRVLASVPMLERILHENITPFWFPRVIEQTHGGYHLHHDVTGRDLGPAPRSLMAQTRTLWFFARMARAGYRRAEMLEAARHGYDFLVSRLRDERHGGFFWEVSWDGTHPLDRTKYQFGQSFAIYALAEYALAAGDAAAATIGEETCEAVERHLRDGDRGGYWDRLAGDWGADGIVPERAGPPRGRKFTGSMIHLLEAYTTQSQVRPGSIAASRLPELLLICASSVVRKNAGACTDTHRADWSPVLDRDNWAVSYGHDLETIHLLIAACEAVSIPPLVLGDLYRSLLAYALRYGQDRRAGGFYREGALGRKADRREKVRWVQAEALLGTIEMYRVTGEREPAEAYLRTLDWIVSRQVDWERGEWHATVPPRGRSFGDTAGPWNEPYHNGRAMVHALAALERLRPGGGGPPSA